MKFAQTRKRHLNYLLLAGILAVVSVIVLIIGISLYAGKSAECSVAVTEPSTDKIVLSKDAKKLIEFLNKVKSEYYTIYPHETYLNPDVKIDEIIDNFVPYDPHPLSIKKRTDNAMNLSKELKDLNLNLAELQPREKKAVAQLEHFLDSIFGYPYDENYYAGDWMMGPNYFCWQPICDVGSTIRSHFNEYSGFKPKSFGDVEKIINTLKQFKKTFEQYQENVYYGVKAGMVRSEEECLAGRNVFKTKFKNIIKYGEQGVLKEGFASPLMAESYYNEIPIDGASKSKNATQMISDVLVEYFGRPVVSFMNFLEKNHSLHCVDSNIASGLANLPLDEIWLNRSKTSTKTTKVLPTGELLDGKKSYEMILPYFTTSKKYNADSIYKVGIQQRDKLYKTSLELAKKITNLTDEKKAADDFAEMLNGPDMFFNTSVIPDNESGEEGGRRCSNMEEAKKNCPVRYKAMQDWYIAAQKALSFIHPKLTNLFYYTGDKATTPNCPVKMVAKFNPSSGSQSYRGAGPECLTSCQYQLPFFLKRPGPKYGVLTVAGHEGRPGHHTQVQGFYEHFSSSTKKDIIDWLNTKSYYTAFTEGWALYSENPLLSDETDLYDNNDLQKYGMVKWQMWRALRLIIDTGLHSRGMTLDEALKMFKDDAWDVTDKAYKDCIRYMGSPGQATAYMIGRLALLDMRKKTEKKFSDAGINFDVKDFHFHILSQGSSPLDYLISYIDDYIECKINPEAKKECKQILEAKSSKQKKYRSVGTAERWKVIHNHYAKNEHHD